MYRTILPILLYVGTIHTAPPESNITYVKLLSPDDAEPTLEPADLRVPATLPDDDDGVESTTSFDEDLTDATETYTTTEPTTTTTTTKRPKRYRSRAKSVTPSFHSKLSYFQKQVVSPSVVNQLDGTPGKRRYVSKCRCERIWNCPKLQISVPRCPNDYFLCCF